MIYIPRELEGKIAGLLQGPESIAIVGPRQAGKTTVIRRLCDRLGDEAVFIDLEDPDEVALFDNDVKAFAHLRVKGRRFVFLDEFQYSKHGGRHLKFLHDHTGAKFIVSGSSCAEVTLKAGEAMTGRIFLLDLYPLSLREFLSWKDPEASSLVRERLLALRPVGEPLHTRITAMAEEMILWGGYPRVAISRGQDEKKLVLKNLVATYLMQDIRGFFRLASEYPLQKLLRALALQLGNIVEYSELGQISGLGYGALKRHLCILEETFITRTCRPWFRNRRQELVKNPKVYFLDTGLRNHLVSDFRRLASRPDRGFLMEGFIASELIKQESEIHFWRTKAKAEVDFVLEREGDLIAVEVKSGQERSAGRSLYSFLRKYRPRVALVLHAGDVSEVRIEGIRVLFLPFYSTILDIHEIVEAALG